MFRRLALPWLAKSVWCCLGSNSLIGLVDKALRVTNVHIADGRIDYVGRRFRTRRSIATVMFFVCDKHAPHQSDLSVRSPIRHWVDGVAEFRMLSWRRAFLPSVNHGVEQGFSCVCSAAAKQDREGK